MSAPCTHLDQIQEVTPKTPNGCEECLTVGGSVGASAVVHDLRACRLLRFVAEQARDEALPRDHTTRSCSRSSRARIGCGVMSMRLRLSRRNRLAQERDSGHERPGFDAAGGTGRSRWRGPEDAPATVVVYGDYQCPYTRRALQAITRLERRIGDQFQLVFRHFPLREIHPNAQGAAELAEAAGGQGKFWEVHDYLFAHQDALDPAHLSTYAVQFGIPSDGRDPGTFEAGHEYADRVEDDLQGGIRSGVGGTSTIFINGAGARRWPR